MVSKITGQLVDPFPVKVKPPFVCAAGIDIFVRNKSPSIGVTKRAKCFVNVIHFAV